MYVRAVAAILLAPLNVDAKRAILSVRTGERV